jgi:oxygen-independent coproporphyrinogen-3 oxidase
MPPRTVAAVIEKIGDCWGLAGDAEITLEANPSSVETARLADVAAAGVNRLSLGVQALDDSALAFLGRLHTAKEALAAVAAARALFQHVSIDLIYGRPGQSTAAWATELSEALRHAVGHLAAYQLTIEKGTPFFTAVRSGAFALPDEATQAELYALTGEVLADAGYAAYEISNYARPGEACRHNLQVWRYGDYAGIGPGAHGRLTLGGKSHASAAIPSPTGWLDCAEINGHGRRRLDPLSTKLVAEEMLLMGLRLAEGVSEDGLRARTGQGIDAWIDGQAGRTLIEGGLLVRDDTGMRLTAAGRPLLDGVLARLLA